MTTLESKKKYKEELRLRKEIKKKWKEEKLMKKMLKKKLIEEKKEEHTDSQQNNLEKEKEISTISIAIPGSILDNAQSLELKTYLAGQIARTACIYKIDEIIVYDDLYKSNTEENVTEGNISAPYYCLQLARILQYLECPQYLRKCFFPLHNDLKYAGLLNPLDAPHHLRADDDFPFREGMVTNRPAKIDRGSLVNVGLIKDIIVDKVLTPGLRVTVKLNPSKEGSRKIKGIIVSPSMPKAETGRYWGYTVRIAQNLNSVFVQCPYSKGYDLSIGTSDKGTCIDDLKNKITYNHALIVFGGLAGLEAALENDPVLTEEDPSILFDYYLNTCPQQGSRTIRTEEAVLISLAELRTRMVSS